MAQTTFAIPADDSQRAATVAVLSLMRRLTDGIIGLPNGTLTIDELTDDLNAAMKRLANKDGELSGPITDAAASLYRALDHTINEHR